MKKIFISQPMRGKTDDEILAEREKAVDLVKSIVGEDVEIVDSFIKDKGDAPINVNEPLWFLAKQLELLSTADVVYFVDGWENARGCKIEHLCAESYGIKIVF